MAKNPLAEVFGYPVDNMSAEAANHRAGRLCPFHNSSGLNCTKNSAIDPLGVCSIHEADRVAITCPVRFRQDYTIVSDAALFLFGESQQYAVLTEVRLNDKYGASAGNIDIVLVALDERGEIIDFGVIEVQAVYISGNVSRAFKEYMSNPVSKAYMEWPTRGYPKPDYLSSSRKRLAPQLIYKGGILSSWNKKMVVVVQKAFFDQLPTLPAVAQPEAQIAWLVYDLVLEPLTQRYKLTQVATHFTDFKTALDVITNAEPGDVGDFIRSLKVRIRNSRMSGTPPTGEVPPTIEPPIETDDLQ